MGAAHMAVARSAMPGCCNLIGRKEHLEDGRTRARMLRSSAQGRGLRPLLCAPAAAMCGEC